VGQFKYEAEAAADAPSMSATELRPRHVDPETATVRRQRRTQKDAGERLYSEL
jgi:hypothetical protein